MAQPMLFDPISIRDVTLKNRVVVAPMHQYSAEKGFATDWHLMNAGRYAAGGAGLVIMESTKVERRGCGTVGDLGIWEDAHIPGLKRCVDFIRLHNSVPGIQLGHSGRKARRFRPWEGGAPLKQSPDIWDWDGWELVSSSGINSPETDPTPRALTRAEIPEVVERWGQGARRAHEAGFDVLDLHMAHGYLIHQFLSPFSNVRNDEYGGSELNRMRFAIEVVESVRAHWPASKPLFVRFSVEDDSGWGPDQSVALAKILKPKGVDVIDCSSGGMRGVAGGERRTRHLRLPGALRRAAEERCRHHEHGGRADRSCRPGRADPAGRPGRPDRARARASLQPELADGRRAEARRRQAIRLGAAAAGLLAGQARAVREDRSCRRPT